MERAKALQEFGDSGPLSLKLARPLRVALIRSGFTTSSEYRGLVVTLHQTI